MILHLQGELAEMLLIIPPDVQYYVSFHSPNLIRL